MRAAEGIRVQLHSRARSDAALVGEERRLRRTTLVTCLVAFPPILLALRFSLQRVANAWQSDPTEELVLIAIVLLLVPIGIVRSYRRLTARPVLPGQLWCSKGAIFSGPQDDDGGFEGSGEFVRDHST